MGWSGGLAVFGVLGEALGEQIRIMAAFMVQTPRRSFELACKVGGLKVKFDVLLARSHGSDNQR